MPIEVLIKTVFILIVVVAALAPVITWIERKQSAVMQDRIGANRADVGGITLLGLLHPLADVVKLLTKEDVVPDGANARHRGGARGDRVRGDPLRRRLRLRG
jgi:NADH-quinone oxidoreductase subunit H